MLPSQPSKVLILTQNIALGRRWAEMLRETVGQVWISPADVPVNERADVIVTDYVSLEEVSGRTGLPLGQNGAQTASARPVGIVAISTMSREQIAPWADVALDVTCSSSELSLACALLGEVVRLRAERDESLRAERESHDLAHADPLTGLPNRRVWDRQLQLQCQRIRTTPDSLWLAIIDLDRFKAVNDAAGFSVGDEVLRSTTRALSGQLRRDDLVARLGGDEFGVLLSGSDEIGVRRVLERLRAAVAGQEMPAGIARLTTSIGYAAAGRDISPVNLFAAAERGLRNAKRAGGDRVELGDQPTD
jgi:diguanylate cyclase (GGDEF)-like protein